MHALEPHSNVDCTGGPCSSSKLLTLSDESRRRLFLVGFAVLILPGSMEQLIIAFLFSLIFLLILSIAMPFKRDDENVFAKVLHMHIHPVPHPPRGPSSLIYDACPLQLCNFALSTFFFFSIIIKVRAATFPRAAAARSSSCAHSFRCAC